MSVYYCVCFVLLDDLLSKCSGGNSHDSTAACLSGICREWNLSLYDFLLSYS